MLIRILLLLVLTSHLVAQKPLPRSTPEAEGVSSSNIINFLDVIAGSPHEMHSIMIVRHGKVVAEGWWKPYAPELKHTLYSLTKTFSATAVGFAVSEKRVSVEDKVISFFPGDLPDTVSKYLSALKVKHLLSMTVGQQPDPTRTVSTTDNWVKTFFRTPIIHEPGTKFLYNSAASHMLSAIVQKVTGQKLIDYLKPRLFDPLGIEGMDWEVDPLNNNTGGWGLRVKTEDIAKFGQLFLQKGKWEGKQILPASWIEEASSKHILQEPEASQGKRDSSDWLQGYGYQMWRSRNNSFRGDGAFGQYMLILPEHDAVIAITSQTPNMQGEFNLVWKHILPAFQSKSVSDSSSAPLLRQKLSALSLPVPAGTAATEQKISGETYTINGGGLKTLRFDCENGECIMRLQTDTALHTFSLGAGNWKRTSTTKKGPYLVEGAKANRVGIAPYKVDGCYYWKDSSTIVATLRYIESPHMETITCSFNGNSVDIVIADSLNQQGKKYKGVAK